jgi:hypothetical protein
MTDQKDQPVPRDAGRGPMEEMSQIGAENPLTRIRDAYTLAATNEHAGNEIEDLMVRHFIETLAEVAMSVASRHAGERNL